VEAAGDAAGNTVDDAALMVGEAALAAGDAGAAVGADGMLVAGDAGTGDAAGDVAGDAAGVFVAVPLLPHAARMPLTAAALATARNRRRVHLARRSLLSTGHPFPE